MKKARKRAKLIFNPGAGLTDSAAQLVGIVTVLTEAGHDVDVYEIHPGSRVGPVITNALKQGISLFAVAGGDNTISRAAAFLARTRATLGIFPTGTRNNIAASLGIPTNLAHAALILTSGQRSKIDLLQLEANGEKTICIEMGMMGLGAALFPAADQLQKGDLTQLGGLVSALVAHTPAQIQLAFDRARQPEILQGHLVILANMPAVGANFQLSSAISPSDGWLDVLIYPDLTKFELIAYAAQVARGGAVDERIQHRRCRRVQIVSDPPLEIMADGVMRGAGALTATLLPRALNIMLPAAPASSAAA